MTWLLIIVAIATGNGPDQPIDPPAHVWSGPSYAACQRAAQYLADQVSIATDGPVSIVYDCRPEEGPST